MQLKSRGFLLSGGALFLTTCCNGTGSLPDSATGRPDVTGDARSTPSDDVAQPTGCVDLAWKGRPIRGGVGLWNGALQAFWMAGSDLAGASIATDDGKLSITKRLLGTILNPITAVGMNDGHFLASTREKSGYAVVTGALGDPEFSQTSFEVPADSGIGSIDFMAWDGDAYNVELDSNSDYSTWAVRLSSDGSLKQPPAKYGRMLDSSYAGYDLGYKISTNAVSGVTYLFSATFLRNITGHTRDGRPLSWIPERGVLTLPLYSGPEGEDKGILPDGGASSPAVSAEDKGGAWIAWSQSTNRKYQTAGVQHVAADGTLGPTMWFNGPAEDPYGTVAQSLLARSDQRALLVATSGNALYTYDVDSDRISPPRRLTVQQPDGSGGIVDYREMQLLSDGTTDWLVMQQGTQRTVAVRVLKITPGCVYPTHPTELLTL